MERRRNPRRVLRWAARQFAPDLVLATSFGPQTIVLMHLIRRLDIEATVFYLDTGLLFPETHALRETLSSRLGIEFVRVSPALDLDEQSKRHGARLWETDPDRCCHLRKVLPLQTYLAGKQAWITGIRRQHGGQRQRARALEWDQANGLVKINPLIDWTDRQVWSYLREHELPFNPLHLLDFRSIGCLPCTRVVRSGDDPRAGRWPGHEKTECGIHSGPEANR